MAGFKVNNEHDDYKAYSGQWLRGRDCYAGSDAVKGAGTLYLPALDSHRTGSGQLASELAGLAGLNKKYADYVKRALFYNAVGRTVDGLAGGVFQKAPVVADVPKNVEEQLKDVTLTGVPLELAALMATRDVLLTGRYGLVVDVATDVAVGGASEVRPYWAAYRPEDVINWRVGRVRGEPALVMVVLRDKYEEETEDPFDPRCEQRYRVLTLEGGLAYTQTVYKKSKDADLFEPVSAVVPLRRGAPLDFIPFTFVGPTHVGPECEKPPLIDLIDLNLSHYRTMAQLEHGRHFTALPQPWISGTPAAKEGDEPIEIGSGGVWILDKDGKAGMVEFSGAGLGHLSEADREKRKMMATLGARLLEEQSSTQETMGAVGMRHAGEHATLRTVAQSVEQAVTWAVRVHTWWAAGSTSKNPKDEKAAVELNKDFFAVRMTAEELKAWTLALQSGAVSYQTFWEALKRGQVARVGVEADEELAEINDKKEADIAMMPNVTADPGAPGDGGPPPPQAKKKSAG